MRPETVETLGGEAFLGTVFSGVFRRTAVVWMEGARRRFEPNRSWITLQNDAGDAVLAAWGGELSRSALQARVVRVALSLHGRPELMRWGVAPPIDRKRFAVERGFSVSFGEPALILGDSLPGETNHSEKLHDERNGAEVISGWIAIAEGTVLPHPLRSGVREARFLRCMGAQFEVSLGGVTTALKAGNLIFIDRAALRWGPHRADTRALRRESRGLSIVLEEEMNRKTDEREPSGLDYATGVELTVDIGAFELPLGDLLALRPGSEILLPCGDTVRGVMKINGAPAALATLSFGPNGLAAQIETVTFFEPAEGKLISNDALPRPIPEVTGEAAAAAVRNGGGLS